MVLGGGGSPSVPLLVAPWEMVCQGLMALGTSSSFFSFPLDLTPCAMPSPLELGGNLPLSQEVASWMGTLWAGSFCDTCALVAPVGSWEVP